MGTSEDNQTASQATDGTGARTTPEERAELLNAALRSTDPTVLVPASLTARAEHDEQVKNLARPLAEALRDA